MFGGEGGRGVFGDDQVGKSGWSGPVFAKHDADGHRHATPRVPGAGGVLLLTWAPT